MRHLVISLLCISLMLVTACGGGKKTDLPDPQPIDSGDMSTIEGETATRVMPEEEDLTEDESTNFQRDEPLGERPLSEMTLEEINAAEFLNNIYYEFDQFDLTPQAVAQLEENGRWLLQNPSVKVIIEGHCDERGTEEYNMALGEKRANSARDFLIRMGISADRLTTASYGESRPVNPQHNEAAWAQNRRAHFRVYAR